jgi:hypothetical protein
MWMTRSVWTSFCLTGSILLATTSAYAQGQGPVQKTKPGTLCGPAMVGLDNVLKLGAIVIVGELHGTNEIERSFGDLVCQAALTGIPVWVGLEIPIDEQAAVDAFFASAGLAPDRRKLLEGSFWNGKSKDGRSSQAMLDLLDRVRLFQASSLKIHAVLFVPSAYKDPISYEAELANNIISVREQHPDGRLIVLVGNAHGRSVNQSIQGGDRFPSMAGHLHKKYPDLITLNAEYAPGEAWTCQGQSTEKPECGAHATGGINRGDKPFIALLKGPHADGYTDAFYVGHITASLPAKMLSH